MIIFWYSALNLNSTNFHSAAHPLNSDTGNYATTLIAIPDIGGSFYETIHVTPNRDPHENIFIARPYKVSGTPKIHPCSYPEYDAIDFILFLISSL